MHAERAKASASAGARRARLPTRTVSLALSVVIHAGLIVTLAAVVWTTVAPPIPGAGGGGVAGAKLSLENSAVAKGESGTRESVRSSSTSESPHPLVGSLEPVLTGSAEDSAPLKGLTSAAAGGTAGDSSGALSTGSLLGSSALLGTPDSSAPAALAPSGGEESVTFGGLGAAHVGSVVYVVDCSGPMVTSLPIVMAELRRSVNKLTPSQRFGVVFFRRIGDDGTGAESFAPVLVHATQSVKELLDTWIGRIEPAGRSSPLAGLELALSLKPDAIFLLSRSIQRSGGNVWELGLEATMARLEELNPVRSVLGGGRRGVLIQTIQFLDEDPTGIMQAIGQRHGGGNGYRVVKRQQDLQEEPRTARDGGFGTAIIDR